MLYQLLLQRAPNPAELAQVRRAAGSAGSGVYFNQAASPERILDAGIPEDDGCLAKLR